MQDLGQSVPDGESAEERPVVRSVEEFCRLAPEVCEGDREEALRSLELSVVSGRGVGRKLAVSDELRGANAEFRQRAQYEVLLSKKTRRYDAGLPLSNKNPKYERLSGIPEIVAFFERLAKASVIGYDIETTGFRPSRGETTLTHQFSDSPFTGTLIRHDDIVREPAVFDMFRNLMLSEATVKAIHNVKFELSFALFDMGIDIRNYFDTMVAAHTVDEESFVGLKRLAQQYFGVDMIEFKEVTYGTERYDVDGPYSVEYACADADFALQLFHRFKPLMDAGGTSRELAICPDARYTDEFYRIEMPLIRVLADMEHHGVLVNPGMIDRMQEEVEARIRVFLAEFRALAGEHVNPDSSSQLAEFLYGVLKLPCPVLTDTGQQSTAIPVLEKLRGKHDIVQKLIDYSHCQQLKSLYLEPFKRLVNPLTAAIHTEVNQCRAVTYRFSSSNPNLQNLKRNEVE